MRGEKILAGVPVGHIGQKSDAVAVEIEVSIFGG
jgi:hypothetical protein